MTKSKVAVLVGVLLLAAGLAGCTGRQTGARPSPSASQPDHARKGVSLSPKSFAAGDFAAFFPEAVKAGGIVTWAGDWTELEKPDSAPYTVSKLAGQHNYLPMIIVGTHREVGGSLTATVALTDANQDRFVTALSNFAAAQKPAFLGLGNEVNRIEAARPDDYQVFVSWFARAAAAVKQVSPATRVFTVFQYEQLNGLNGGLFGGSNEPAAAKWDLLADFPGTDLIAFTSYPYLIYQEPADVPADYYARISTHTDKSTGFTEIGWPSATEAPGYPSTPAEQSRFIDRFRALTTGSGIDFVIWPFLYDQPLSAPFASVGLIGRDGVPKPALDTWQKAAFG